MIAFAVDYDDNLFVSNGKQYICVIAEECGTAMLGEIYNDDEREFFPILTETALSILRPRLQYDDRTYTLQAALALTYLIKTYQLKGKLILDNGEQINPNDESSPFEVYPVIKLAGRGYDRQLLCNDGSEYDVVGLTDSADRAALRKLHRKLYPRLMLGVKSDTLMLFITPITAVCLRDDSNTFQPGESYAVAHCDDKDQWRYAYTEEVLDLLEA